MAFELEELPNKKTQEVHLDYTEGPPLSQMGSSAKITQIQSGNWPSEHRMKVLEQSSRHIITCLLRVHRE
jgi:hypothetical protein